MGVIRETKGTLAMDQAEVVLQCDRVQQLRHLDRSRK